MSHHSSKHSSKPQQHGTGKNSDTTTVAPTGAASAFPLELAAGLNEAYECSKKHTDWNKVSNSLMVHPEWLTQVPEGRKWAILHQIVYSGNVSQLNEALALQRENPEFRLLHKTADNKTIRDVANERRHLHEAMFQRVEHLVVLDTLLNNAKDSKWDLVKQAIQLRPSIVNEKPPHQRYFLVHLLACVGELAVFKDLTRICEFKFDLMVENKTIIQIAREHNKIAFAEYIESLIIAPGRSIGLSNLGALSKHSPGFHDDPGMSFIPVFTNPNIPSTSLTSTSPNPDGAAGFPVATHSLYVNPQMGTTTMDSTPGTPGQGHGNPKHKPHISNHMKQKITSIEDEDEEYDKQIKSKIETFSKENFVKSITCCITKAILRDPVVAADGFTYEREAITHWLHHSNRSPMTNEELSNLELKPNYAIKAILQSLHGDHT